MGKELTTTVVLNGRATSGFTALADKVTQLGYVISQLGGKVGEWEKESLETYKNYETYMLEAKGAMSATAESASELERTYAALEEHAQEWASTTIFHTNDVAKAISEAAHAGWDYEKMLKGIPEAMVLAQAGNTDLSSGLDMLIKTINGTGIAFEDGEKFVDQWVMAANSSATTVSELGEAMEKMGATARFGDSTEELLTMLAVLANTGTVGSAAGTLLRNSMIRLIAPTKNAREAMEGLGVEADEISEAVGSDSETLAEVNEMLSQVGFSAYTGEGKLKPFLTTFKDLNKALEGMTEQDRNKVLSAIFPTRTITGAMALLQAAADDYDGLLAKITDSEGYASKIAKIQTSGLMGSEELFKSKWEEFSRKIGEILSDPVESAYDILGGFIDTLNEADPTILAAIAGAATSLAAAGPALITAGIGMKMFSILGPYGTAILAAVVGIGALVGYFTELNKIALENNFGKMALDMDTINEALEGIGDEKAGLLSNLKQFSEEFDTLQQNYDKAAVSLSEGLTSKMIAGTTLTDDDKKKFQQYGEDMITNIQTGITTATAEKMSFVSLLFGDSNTEEDSNEDLANNPAYASIISLLKVGMGAAKDRAAELSQELRKALTSAFADDKLTDEELQNIQSIMDQMNDLMSGLNPSDVERNKMRIKSQRVSLESMKEFSEEVNAAKEATFGELDDQMLDLQATLQTYYDWALQHGQKFINPMTGELVNPAEVDINSLIAETERQYSTKRAAWEGDYNDILMRGWENALRTSDTGALFRDAENLMRMAQMGIIAPGAAGNEILRLNGNQGMLKRSLEQLAAFYDPEGNGDVGRGWAEMARLAAEYRGMEGEENQARADWFERMYMMGTFGNGTPEAYAGMMSADAKASQGLYSLVADLFGSSNIAAQQQKIFDYYNNELTDAQRAFVDQNIEQLKNEYDLAGIVSDVEGIDQMSPKAAEWLAAYRLGIRPGEFEEYRITPEAKYGRAMEQAQDAVAQQYAYIQSLQEKQGKIAGEIDAANQRMEANNYGITDAGGYHRDWTKVNGEGGLEDQKVEVDAEIEAAMAELEKLQGELDELSAHPPIDVNAEAKLDSSAVDDWVPPDKYAWVYYKAKDETGEGEGEGGFAEGGRADTPSLFGEAGPEWAIPEAHTQRTADLLRAAAAASGFTWGELLATNGGLNAGGGISVNIQSYSPVINANDATGVADELAKDKARLGAVVKKAVQSAIENMNLHNSIEVYA